MIVTKAGHFQGISHAAPRLVGQQLQILVDIVMGHQHSIAFLEKLLDASPQCLALLAGDMGSRGG